LSDDPRFSYGIPNTDNANYLWIQLFYNALNDQGRAGFVMANSAGDARGTELEIRKKLIQTGGVDVIVSVGSNFFYTVMGLSALRIFMSAPNGDAGLLRGAKPVRFTAIRSCMRAARPPLSIWRCRSAKNTWFCW